MTTPQLAAGRCGSNAQRRKRFIAAVAGSQTDCLTPSSMRRIFPFQANRAAGDRTRMPSRPLNAIIANVLACLPWPAMALLDYANAGCGDGLCGMFSGLLILGGLAIATLVFVLRSAKLSETPALLRLTPFLLWSAALVPMLL